MERKGVESSRYHRRSIRLRGWDYSEPGGYFVTICAHGRECLFGEITGGEMRLSRFGTIVRDAWNDLPNHYPHVQLDEFVVMPNHVHGIIVLTDDSIVGANSYVVGASSELAPTGTTTHKRHPLSEIIRSFKTFSARRINTIRQTPGVPVWQRNYYEHIVRNDADLNRIRAYIEHNPFQWTLDEENPDTARPEISEREVDARPKITHGG